jgi:Uma2 family endonuclease
LILPPVFNFPIGAKRSPDVAWIPNAKWQSLTPQQREQFLPFAPDFAVELRYPSDSLAVLRAKMAEYIDNGTQLGWLINPSKDR